MLFCWQKQGQYTMPESVHALPLSSKAILLPPAWWPCSHTRRKWRLRRRVQASVLLLENTREQRKGFLSKFSMIFFLLLRHSCSSLQKTQRGSLPGIFVSAPAGSLLTSLRLHATEDPWPAWEWPRPQPVLTPSLSGVGRSLPNVFLPAVLSCSPKGIYFW